MNPACLLDGAPVAPDAALPLDARGVLLGDGVFETMRAYGGRPFALAAHLERLERSAAWARLRVDATSAALARECAAVANAVAGDAAVRVFVLRGARGPGRLAEQPTRRLVVAEPIRVEREPYERGVSACVVAAGEFGTGEGPHAKYARYLPRLLARDEARARGYDEALLAGEGGAVVEAATACVFVVANGGLVCASILESITRDVVIELARARGIRCQRRSLALEDIAGAGEMFLASSLRELVPIVRVDERVIASGAPGPLTRALHAALRARAGATEAPPWEPI